MKFIIRFVFAAVLAYFAYDYYEIRQQAMCAHDKVVHGSGER